jgi:ribosomal-protein-alanine N-acetyltransferase
MSSVPKITQSRSQLRSFEHMQLSDLEEVHQIERNAYPYPWTRGNFLDSLSSGYDAWVVRDNAGAIAGYFLLMLVLDEAHLLNITVRPDLHGQGIGRWLLDQIVQIARDKNLTSILLEVRPSNTRALAVYEKYGFMQIGRRRGYYPAANNLREDAIVMRLIT